LVITLHNVSKKFVYQHIFKHVNLTFEAGKSYAVVGANGSGKSTFLTILAGFTPPSAGKIEYKHLNTSVDSSEIYKYVALASPYLELIEEFTLSELLDFHFKFTNYRLNENKQTLIEYLQLDKALNKKIKFFSSGMKQRVKLGLAFFSEKPILLLDEPTVNLDVDGVKWYENTVMKFAKNRLLVISSNVEAEYAFVNQIINISSFN
jgi:ABC-type multidrug transport system ATPase subunit